jgi:hypothetical protein
VAEDQTKSMNPVSGEQVEADGFYETEWGREEFLERGEEFPSDVMRGHTEWKMVRYPEDIQHTGMTLSPNFNNEIDERKVKDKVRHDRDSTNT